jgi:hypothetical protein
MNDFIVLVISAALAVISWLLIVLSDRLMGSDK